MGIDPVLKAFQRQLLATSNLEWLLEAFEPCKINYEKNAVETREMAREILHLRSILNSVAKECSWGLASEDPFDWKKSLNIIESVVFDDTDTACDDNPYRGNQ